MGGQGGVEDIFDVFSDMFGGGFRGTSERGENQPGEHLYLEVVIKKSDLGAKKTFEFEAMDSCGGCGGNGIERGYSMITCEECKGAGQVRKTSRSAFGFFTRVGICNKCGGKGRFPEKKCHKCSGDGRIKTRRKIDIIIPENIDSDYNIAVPKGGNAGKNGLSGDLIIHLKLRRAGFEL